jgi:glycosyltransferase involved in cell wall biosynthesis
MLRAVPALSRFDLHHFHSAEPLLISASLRCRGVRRYYTHRGGVIDYPQKQRLRYRTTGLLLRRFTALSANTAHGAACAAELLRINRERFAVTYNGIDFDLLQPRTDAAEIRRRLGLRGKSFVIGTVAHLREWKRIDRLIDAVAAIADPAVQLLIVGDGEDLPRLESRAAHWGLDGTVIFAGKQADVADYLQVMDAFCLPSTELESFGNAAVEAMALGVPSIVFRDGGGLLEHIVPGRTGFVVGSDAELVQTIRRLVDDPTLREQVGTAGRQFVRTRYTLANAGQSYRELYGMQPMSSTTGDRES